uniref:Uncharacterized protein n=1 Tax=Anopheles culicifacies TaxID=139723 RepID=A0A2C9GUJ6_9DIPT
MEQIVKTRDVEKFVSETKYFLDEFDSIISHWDLSGNFFLHYLIEIHENVTQLLSRFTTLSLEGVGDRKSKPFFNLKCCDLEFQTVKDLRLHHHSCRHKKSHFEETDNCEVGGANGRARVKYHTFYIPFLTFLSLNLPYLNWHFSIGG